jgi:hypothetical protein
MKKQGVIVGVAKTGRLRKHRGGECCGVTKLAATINNGPSWPRSRMNILSQQKQTGSVVEHKGMYPTLGSEAVIQLQAQSLTWDTFCAVGSQISLIAAFLQLIQQLAWDTLSHLQISDEIAGISITFYFTRAIRPVGHHSQNILGIPQKFLLRIVADSPSKKTLSRCGFLVAYRIGGLK